MSMGNLFTDWPHGMRTHGDRPISAVDGRIRRGTRQRTTTAADYRASHSRPGERWPL